MFQTPGSDPGCAESVTSRPHGWPTTLYDVSSFPVTRLRRLRRTSGIRNLVRETRLDPDDFVMPLFVGPGAFSNEDLPGLGRHSVESVVAEAGELGRRGGAAAILFGGPEEEDEEGAG